MLFGCIMVSCIGVYYDDLGNNYAWLESRSIVKIKEKGDNYLYCEWLIRPQVLNYAYDDRFIIAYQFFDETSGHYDSIQIEEQKDSLFAQFAKLKAMQRCYWIIDKETDKVMGPMAKEEFDRQRKALNVEAKMSRFHQKRIR